MAKWGDPSRSLITEYDSLMGKQKKRKRIFELFFILLWSKSFTSICILKTLYFCLLCPY